MGNSNPKENCQENSDFSFQSPSPLELLWNVQMFLRSCRKTQDCSTVNLDSNSCSISWVLAWPSTRAWKAMKFRTSTSKSSSSVAIGSATAADWKPSAPSLSVLSGMIRWFLSLILARRDDESREDEEGLSTFPLKWALEVLSLLFSFISISVSCKKK